MKEALLPDVSLRALSVWNRSWQIYKKHCIADFVGNLGEHFLYLLAMGFGLGGYLRVIEGMSYVQFIAPGLLVSLAMWTSTFEATFGVYTRMKVQRTYEGILATPCSIGDIVLGDMLWAATRATIGSSIMMVILVGFGLVHSPLALLVFPFVYLEGLLFASMGMIAAAIAPSYFFFNFHFSLTITPMFFFSGIFFPLTQYPAWVKSLSWVMPLTHAVNISRALITEGRVGVILGEGLWLLAVAAALFFVAHRIVARKMIQ